MVFGCDGGPIDSGPTDKDKYRFDGLFVRDINLDICRVETRFTRDQATFSTGTVIFGTDTLTGTPPGYRITKSPATSFANGAYQIQLVDSTIFADTVLTLLTNAPQITNIIPANRINNGGGQVRLEWAGVSGAEGYVVATVPADSAYKAKGYSAWVTSQATAWTIPPDAFRWSNGIDLDTGLYYVYVYTFTSAPDSALSRTVLPVTLPSDLTDNISTQTLSGSFGSVAVSLHDSVHVATQ